MRVLHAVVAAVVLTAGPAGAHPPASALDYRWVTPVVWSAAPPAEGRQAMLPPELVTGGAVDVWTPDLQAVLKVPIPEGVRTGVEVAVDPIDPAGLPPLEIGGAEANGNAYRVRAEGDGWSAQGVELLLQAPFPVTGVVALGPDGWSAVAAEVGADGVVRVMTEAEGTYLAIADRTDGHGSPWARVTHDPSRAALLVMALLVVALVPRSRRRSTRRG